VPIGTSPERYTVTSADAVPAVIVTFPGAMAVMTGASSADRVATALSDEVHTRPVTAAPASSSAWIVRVSPTTRLMTSGVTVIGGELPDGTVNVCALRQMPFCCTLTTPVTAFAGTVTTAEAASS
jgi:hypothetical protein